MAFDSNKTLEALGSLDNLHDIITPEAIGVFPLAPGWYVLLLLLITYAIHFSFKKYKKYQKDLYRREALSRLSSLESNKDSALELVSLSKIVGLLAYGREEVAKLSGESWWEFMQRRSNVSISDKLKEEIDRLLYQPEFELQQSSYDEIAKMVRVWVETHKVDSDD